MRVLLAGASGLIGGRLRSWLPGRGHELARLVRRLEPGPGEIAWDPARGQLEPAAVSGFDAAVVLSGAGLAERRWSAARRRELEASRVAPVALLARALAAAARPPRVLVTMSGVGWYGDRGDAWLDEASAPGEGFLASLARAWEAAAQPAADAGVRVVALRTGIVLAREGGALAQLLPLARLGLSGPRGSGRQWWSWITLDDFAAALLHVLSHEALRGGVNVVAPEPVTNAAFARELGRALGRPALLPAPALALRLALGRGLADEMLLASQRVRPAALLASGFGFGDPTLPGALARLLART